MIHCSYCTIAKSNRVCATQSPGLSISLSALAIIVLTATAGTNWCSIGPLACATPGQRSKNAQTSVHEQIFLVADCLLREYSAMRFLRLENLMNNPRLFYPTSF